MDNNIDGAASNGTSSASRFEGNVGHIREEFDADEIEDGELLVVFDLMEEEEEEADFLVECNDIVMYESTEGSEREFSSASKFKGRVGHRRGMDEFDKDDIDETEDDLEKDVVDGVDEFFDDAIDEIVEDFEEDIVEGTDECTPEDSWTILVGALLGLLGLGSSGGIFASGSTGSGGGVPSRMTGYFGSRSTPGGPGGPVSPGQRIFHTQLNGNEKTL